MKVRRLALLAVAAVAALACGGTGSSGPATGSTITLGAPLGLTGSLTKESKLTQQGYDLWSDWINARGGILVNNVKHPVVIKYYDDTSNANQSAVLMQKLITEDKASFLLGPYGSAATATDAVVAETNQIPMVEANGAAQSNFSLEVANAINTYAPSQGMNVVLFKKYKNGATNLSAEVQAAKAVNADIVLNSGHLQEAIAINKAAKEQKLNAKIFAYSVGPSTPDFISALGADANFVYDGSQWTPQVKYTPAFYLSESDYVTAYKAKFPGIGDPDYHVAESTAACLALQRAIENAGSLDPKKVRDALAALDVTVFFGEIKFDPRGINIYKPMVVEQIQNGTHHTVFPADVADAQPMYPTPSWDQR